jgi:hypothetical protein
MATFKEVLNELVRTEQSFVDKLVAIEHFITLPLLARTQLLIKPTILSHTQTIRIFGTTRLICSTHTQFNARLKGYQDKMELLGALPGIFREFIPQFQLAITPFLLAFNHATEAIKALLGKSEAFKELMAIAECCAGFPVQSLMVEPVQRIPRYQLVIKELIKACAELDSQLKAEFENVQALLQKVMSETEQVTILADRKYRVFYLQNTLFQNQIRLVNDNRLWCLDGHVDVLYYKQKVFGKMVKPFLLVLFSDVIMYISERRSPARLKGTFDLSEVQLIDNIDTIQKLYNHEAQMLESQSDLESNPEISSVEHHSAYLKNSHMRNLEVFDEKDKEFSISDSNFLKSYRSNPEFGESMKGFSFKASAVMTFAEVDVNWERTFAIRSPSQKTLICVAPNLIERQRWIESISAAISEVQSPQRESSIVVIDSEAFFDFDIPQERRDAIAGIEKL